MRWVVRPVELTPQPPGTGAHLPAKGKAPRPTLYGVDRFGGRGRDGCSQKKLSFEWLFSLLRNPKFPGLAIRRLRFCGSFAWLYPQGAR
jgi:hypothetical protein